MFHTPLLVLAICLAGCQADKEKTTSSDPLPVVGAFPEPFLHGVDGKRLPVRVECAPVDAPACDAVEKALVGAGVVAAKGGVAQSFTKDTLRVLVGPYAALRDDHAVRQLEQGPRASGVYAQPTSDGKRIELLRADGARVRSIGPRAGLVAATRYGDDKPVWVVTGTDEAGVAAAVTAFNEQELRDRRAVAVSDGLGIPLPVR